MSIYEVTFGNISISHTRSKVSPKNDTVYAAIAAVGDSSPQNPVGNGIQKVGIFLGNLNNAGHALTVPVVLRLPSIVANSQIMLAFGAANLGGDTQTPDVLVGQLANLVASTVATGTIRPSFVSTADLGTLMTEQMPAALNSGLCNGGLIADARTFFESELRQVMPISGEIWSIPGIKHIQAIIL